MGKFIDLTGQKFDRWTVVELAGRGKDRRPSWLCRCDCGTEKVVSGGNLRTGNSKSCGCLTREFRVNDITGEKFGRYTVLHQIETYEYKNRGVRYLCRCECGTEKIVRGDSLRASHIVSCGCYQRSLPKKKVEDLTGRRFTRLTVLSFLGPAKRKGYLWTCKCDCGTVKAVNGHELRYGSTKSCGCLNQEQIFTRARKHGQSGTKEYARAASNKRRAQKLQATPSWFASEEEAVREFYESCPEGFHVDHKEPILGQRYGICGLHTLANLQYLSAADNIKKSNKFTPYIQYPSGQIMPLEV